MKLIEHICEPVRLLLAWQAPEGLDRTRFIVGELYKAGNDVHFRYTTGSDDYKSAKELGFWAYPAFKNTGADYSHGVLETFLRRLPPRSRSDFGKYLQLFRLPQDRYISDFALLGYTGAKLPTDGFSIIHPFDNLAGPCEFLLEIAGFRHKSKIPADALQIGDNVALSADEDNKYDKYAVQIEYKDSVIGYVNRGLSKTFREWLERRYKVAATIERVNGHPVRPLVYLFVKVRPEARKR